MKGLFNHRIPPALATLLLLTGCGIVPMPPPDPAATTKGAPASVQYTTNPAKYPIGVAITPNVLSANGAPINTITLEPAVLPDGLSVDPSTGTITGTPTTLSSQTIYTVTVYNNYGSNFVKLSLAVTDLPPTLSVPPAPVILTRNVAMAPITPTLGGGATTSCTASPALPAGLSIDPSTCEISGTPIQVEDTTVHSITATNEGGSSSSDFTLTVTDTAPDISYGGTPFTFNRGVIITPASATNTGGQILSCSSNPALPAGLTLSSDCQISGIPTAVSTDNYTITATNPGGSSSPSISITVQDIPPVISYAASPYKTKKGTSVSISVTSTGGTIDNCSASPALPAGLSISSSCKITGTPTAVSAAADYTITATNTSTPGATVVNLEVTDIPPTLSYLPTSNTLTNKTPSAILPITGGGAIVTCIAAPSLPNGLTLGNTDCKITGTPTSAQVATSYTITAANSGGSATASITLTILEKAPTISYIPNSQTLNRTQAISPAVTVTNAGGPVTGCVVTPPLPAGVILSSSCDISGTPTTLSATTSYTVTGTNSAGSSSTAITLTVIEPAPSISYPSSPYTFTKGSAIAPINVTNAGGTPDSCTPSPALPAGLSINSSCTVTGTPTAVAAAANYTVTATNASGSSDATLSITVNDVAPNISYPLAPFTLTKGAAASLTANNTGGAIVNCSDSPSLPAGLSVNAATCAITGTPSAVTAAASYTITATNSGGNSAVSILISVNDVAPTLSYSPSSYTYAKNGAVTINATTGGGTITSCSSSPSLPSGFTLNNTTCNITGTATTPTPTNTYSITAANSGGNVVSALTITVNDDLPAFTFSGSPYTFTKGTAIATTSPTHTGGTVTSCSSSPSLPGGLSLSNVCVITGTPTVVSASASYTITGTNSAGSGSTSIVIAVNDIAPTISYAGSPFVYTKGSAIAPLTPTTGGGAITSCSSSPSLPAGLSLSSLCVLSGTPTALADNATYTITASNSGGTANANIDIAVDDLAPDLSYTGAPYTWTKGVALTPITPSNSGGTPTSCMSTPLLPSGLNLSSDCVISGTPTVIAGTDTYQITATNTGGSVDVDIDITVNDQSPVISYAGAPFSFTKDVAIANKTPANTGGAIVSCSIAPALPSGLNFNTTTCVISGTPTALAASQSYAVTATNTGGSGQTNVSIAVVDAAPALNYIPTSYSFTFTKGAAITDIVAGNTGGPITACSPSPAFPNGLTLAANCDITGTPTVLSPQQTYTITASNTGGSSPVNITIAVNDALPVLTYAGSPYSLPPGNPATLTPTNTGGTVTSCGISPALPSGLSISSTCVISGTPDTLSALTTYSVSATNSGGTASFSVDLGVINDPVISYVGSPFSYPKGTPIAPLSVVNTGGAITSCSSTPSLPSGLSIANDCKITGTPTVAVASASYTIRASNAGGFDETDITIGVPDAAPSVTYTGSPFTFTKNSAITPLTATNTGGSVTLCSINPALPAGLSIHSTTCAISGTPTALSGTATYTITAHNDTGDSTPQVDITVNDIAPSINYSVTSYTFFVSEAITAISPSNTGGAITSCSIAPSIAATGLTFNTTTCNLSGTPTSTSGSTSYTITASNSGGNSAKAITVEVKAQPQLVYYRRSGVATLSHIYRLDSNGQNETIISSASSGDSSLPVFSPVSSSIAYVSYRTGSTNPTLSANLWKSNADGSIQSDLTSNTAGIADEYSLTGAPQFSPNGTKITFASKTALDGSNNGTATSSTNIFIVNSDGSNRIALTGNTGTGYDSIQPTFSADGNWVFFASKTALDGSDDGSATSSYNIWKVKIDGTSRTALTSETAAGRDCTEPYASPDGQWIVYTSWAKIGATSPLSSNIWRIKPDGTSKGALTLNTSSGLNSKQAKFSADSSLIVFASQMNIGASATTSFNIWTMNPDGSNASYVTSTITGGAAKDSLNPHFRPDGGWILFESFMDTDGASSSSNLFRIKPDGSSQEYLTNRKAATNDSYLSSHSLWYQP